jgi:hypothetical protein
MPSHTLTPHDQHRPASLAPRTFDTKGQSAPDAAVTLTEAPLQVHYPLRRRRHPHRGRRSCIPRGSDRAREANEHSSDVSHELNFVGSSVARPR